MLLPLSDTLELCLMLEAGKDDKALHKKVNDLHGRFEQIDHLDFSEIKRQYDMPFRTAPKVHSYAVLTNEIAIRILPLFPLLETLNISGEGGELLTREIVPRLAELPGLKKLIASPRLVNQALEGHVNLFTTMPQLKELEILPHTYRSLNNKLYDACPNLKITYSKGIDDCSIA